MLVLSTVVIVMVIVVTVTVAVILVVVVVIIMDGSGSGGGGGGGDGNGYCSDSGSGSGGSDVVYISIEYLWHCSSCSNREIELRFWLQFAWCYTSLLRRCKSIGWIQV